MFLIPFLENNIDSEVDYQVFCTRLNELKIDDYKYELSLILLMISKIAKNYQRKFNFLDKLDRILRDLENDIKQLFFKFRNF